MALQTVAHVGVETTKEVEYKIRCNRASNYSRSSVGGFYLKLVDLGRAFIKQGYLKSMLSAFFSVITTNFNQLKNAKKERTNGTDEISVMAPPRAHHALMLNHLNSLLDLSLCPERKWKASEHVV